MLQEVHCSAETSDLWSTEWGCYSLFCGFSSRKSGVCILFNNNFELKVLKTFMDDEGRYILCDIMANEKNITLVNLYAPNDDNPNFFDTLSMMTLITLHGIELASAVNVIREITESMDSRQTRH